MEYSEIFSKALNKLKSQYELPKSGFLTGGSLANLIWEEISGNKTEINDIDIFIINEVVKDYNHVCPIRSFTNTKHERIIYEDYRGLNYRYDSKITYLIEKATTRDIFNEIYYSSTTKDPQIIIDSFDINCCQVGYELSEQKFYWTEHFLEFLKTGKLKITDLRTPAHTAIRLAKKMSGLNATCDKVEFDIIKYVIKHRHIIGTNRFRFKEKYKLEFEKYSSILENDFKLVRDLETEKRLKETHSEVDALYQLEVDVDSKFLPYTIVGLSLPKEYMFFMRSINNNKLLEKIWADTHLIIDTNYKIAEYIDYPIMEKELKILKNLIRISPKCVKNLKGYTLSKQMNWINRIVKKFNHDLIIAISILEEYPIYEDLDLEDDMNLLMLELGVRKKIVSDPRNKVGWIFGTDEKEKEPSNQSSWIDELF
jgi:hypothetical protein